jgi:hypothetical protein
MGDAGLELDPGRSVVAISCTRAFCAALDDSELCMALGSGELIASTDPETGAAASWSVKFGPDSSALFGNDGMSCASASTCAVAAYSGSVLSSDDPGRLRGASWQVQKVDRGHRLQAISCVSTSLCVAVDERGRAVIGVGRHHRR